MLSETDIKSIIARGEDTTAEFKESPQDDLIHTLVAFANGYNGVPRGVMLIGVDKWGEVLGLQQNQDELQQTIANWCRSNAHPPLSPLIHISTIEGKTIMVVVVERSPSRPHRVHGVCYIRVGSTTRVATSDEENRIREETTFRPFDDTTVPKSSAQDLDASKVQTYYRASRSPTVTESDTRDIALLSRQLGLVRQDTGGEMATVAAILAFGSNPQNFFILSSINAIRFRGTTVADQILDRDEIRGTADELIVNGSNFVKKYSAVSSIIPTDELKRVDISEYPTTVVREAIANAVVHRDYGDPGAQIDLYIFDDRIEVRSPGGLGGGLTIQDLVERTGQKRYLRNPSLAGYLLELHLIEKAGTGIARMFNILQDNGSPPPEFYADHNSVRVTVKAHPDYSARRKYEEGLLARDRGDSPRAKGLFEEAIRIKPNYSEATAALASLEASAGALERSRELYSKALTSDPHNAGAILSWAEQEDRLGNVQEARKLYERATISQPQSAAVWHSWATMERRLGNNPRARELFQRAVDLAPQNSANWQALGQLEIRAGNFRQAQTDLEKALEVARDDYTRAWILSDLAFALDRLHAPQSKVEERYKESLALNPNSPQTNHSYGVFLHRIGRTYDAENYFSRARMLGWKDRT